MQRDMNLVRQILLELEKSDGYSEFRTIRIQGQSSEVIAYHLILLYEAGLIEGTPNKQTFNSPASISTRRLTWDGHEFLDLSRNDKLWKKALEEVKKAGAPFTLDILKGLLLFWSKKQLGI